MREISPTKNLGPDEYLELAPPLVQELVAEIRRQKLSSTRPCPSSLLIDRSSLLTSAHRRALLDAIASKVDENLFGRAEMCFQFADLLQRALAHLGFPARSVVGEALYFVSGRKVFQWLHAWVRIGKEVVDGNVDILSENPAVPPSIIVLPYWGPISETPADRKLREHHGRLLEPDPDVTDIWWPELRIWLDEELKAKNGMEEF